MIDVARGMAWLHAIGLIHKDLKPENVVLTGDRQHAKLGNFGLTKHYLRRDLMEDERLSPYEVRSLYYTAPECLLTNEFTCAADVYSFGIMLHSCFVTFDGKRTYDARRILGHHNPADFLYAFQDAVVHRHERPIIPESASSFAGKCQLLFAKQSVC